LSYGAARRFQKDRTHALLTATVTGAMPALTLSSAGVYADVPLAVYILLTTGALMQWRERGERGALLIALFGSACLPWVKREGIVYILALGAAALWLYRREPSTRWGVVLCVAASSFIAGAWSVFLRMQGTNNIDFLPLTFETARTNLNRLPEIALYFAKALSSYEWCVVWLLALLVLTARLFTRPIMPRDVLLVAPVLYLCAMAGSFLFSAFTPFSSHLASSGSRLIAQVTPLVVLWLGSQTAVPQLNRLNSKVSDASV
jgi:hypothetical protein